MYKCICGKLFETIGSFNGHKAKCEIYQGELKFYMEKHLTIEFLEWWIYKKKKSINGLTKLLNNKYRDKQLNYNVDKIIQWCRELGIKTWTVKESNNLPHVRKFRSEHNNLAKGAPGYIKRQKTLEKEGIVNVYQREEVKQKIKQTMLDRYGVESAAYLSQNNNGRESKPHLKVIDFLIKNGYKPDIDFISEPPYVLKAHNEELNKIYCPRPDIIFPNKKIVIEIYGDRWHANPNVYSKDSIIHTWYGDETPEMIHQRDRIREDHIKNLGYKLIILWESEIKDNDFSKLNVL